MLNYDLMLVCHAIARWLISIPFKFTLHVVVVVATVIVACYLLLLNSPTWGYGTDHSSVIY